MEKAEGRPWLPLLAIPFIREDVAVIYGFVVLMAGLPRKRRSWRVIGASAIAIGLAYFAVMEA
jgi:hypothetical protein